MTDWLKRCADNLEEFEKQYAHKVDAFASTDQWRQDALCVQRLVSADGTLLDLGCGTGRLLRIFQRRQDFDKLIGIDVNEQSLKLAREHVGEDESVQLHHGMDDVPKEIVDVAIIMHALPQFNEPHKMLNALWEKMRPGAQIVVIVHNRRYTQLHWLANKLKSYRGDPTITTRFTKGELVQMMRDHGFQIDRAFNYGGGERSLSIFKPRIAFSGRRPA